MTPFREISDIDMPEIKSLEQKHTEGASALELLCFSEPWSAQSLEILCRDNNFGVVIEEGGEVVAYGGMTCVLDEGSITNIAVHPDYRRRGLGRAILCGLLDRAQKNGIAAVFLEVRESNSAARSLYLSEGFFECGVRKNFYRRPTENAVQMKYEFK